MKSINKVLTMLLTAVFLCPFAACTKEETHPTLINSAVHTDDVPLAGEAEFEAGLPEESLYPAFGDGKTYYVSDKKGSDTKNDGLSAEKPFESIKKINKLIEAGEIGPGDSVLFRCGDNFKGTLSITVGGEENNPVTFASYCDEEKYENRKPRIYNKDTDVITFKNVSNLVIRDLNVQVQSSPRTSSNPSGIPTAIFGEYEVEYPEVVWDEETPPEPPLIHGELVSVGGEPARCKNIYIVNNEIAGGSHLYNNRGICIWARNDDFRSCPDNVLSNVRITGNTVSKVGRSGIAVHAWLDRSDTSNFNNAKQDLFSDVVLDGNTVFNIGQMGAYIGCCSDSKIVRNVIYNTGAYPNYYSYAEGDCGIMAIGSKNVDIMYNVTYENHPAGSSIDAMGIDIDWNTDNVRVQYNHCYDNDGGGIGTMANNNCLIANNRVENNRCTTNNKGQISVGDFTSRYYAVAEDMHSVRNLKISDNIVVYTGEDKDTSMFYTTTNGGDPAWRGNSFTGNHVVSYNDVDEYFVNAAGASVPWNAFEGNRYYGTNLQFFITFDGTPSAAVSNGGQATEGTTDFSEWQKRDIGSSYEEVSFAVPGKPTAIGVTYSEGTLFASWSAAEGEPWHYNVYLSKAGETLDYTKLIGETKETALEIPVEFKGEYYLTVQAESDCGIYGGAQKFKIVLK